MDALRMAALRHWSITLVTAVVTAAILVIRAVLLLGGGGEGSSGPRAGNPLGRVSRTPTTAAPAPSVGPEGVPLPAGKALAPAGSPAGRAPGGIRCGSTEQLRYHVHARLTIFAHGTPRAVPLGVGIGAPRQVDHTPRGAFASDGSCFSLLHTHAADGIIHVEAPGRLQFRLGQFFAVWGQRLDRTHLGPVRGRVAAYVNGQRYRGDPRGILLLKHAQIQLEVGKHVSPVPIQFPAGL